MTRINAGIKPVELCDKHLLAEIRELPRILNKIKSGKARPDKNKIPVNFVLGKGHETFFYNKLKYLIDRHKRLIKEANERDFNIMDYSSSYKNLPLCLCNDYEEKEGDRIIISDRIKERLQEMTNVRYYGEKIDKHHLIKNLQYGA